MSDSLRTYLQDHLAGAADAVSLTKHIRDQHSGTALGQFASGLLAEIESDRSVLQKLAEDVGVGPSEWKEATAWLGEKATRLKFSFVTQNKFGTFEALELLELGVHGKWALWRALAVLAPSEPRLKGVDFDVLMVRAAHQRDAIESQRLELARTSLQTAA